MPQDDITLLLLLLGAIPLIFLFMFLRDYFFPCNDKEPDND